MSDRMHSLGVAAGALALGVALSGCGGAGGGSVAAPGAGSRPTAVAALYLGTGQSPGFLAITRDRGQGQYDWYALRTDSRPSAIIYSGRLIAGVDGQAQLSALRRMDGLGAVQDATATLSAVSATAVQGVFDDADLSRSASFTAQARAGAGDALAGDWSGVWIDGSSSNSSYTVRMGPGPGDGTRVALSPVLGCPGMELVLGAYEAGSGLYPVQISYLGQDTLCARRGQRLSGVALVHTEGTTTRLSLVAVDDTGSGISFRAER